MAAHTPLNVAAAQVAAVPGDVAANLRKHLDVIEAARSAQAAVLLFPELSLTGHGGGAAALEIALRADSGIVKTLESPRRTKYSSTSSRKRPECRSTTPR